MINFRLLPSALGALLVMANIGPAQTAAKADTASTAAIAAGAAAIAGALLYDSSNHPYYIRDNHRYYVTAGEANYYRSHHHGVTRKAFVPEQEYAVKRDPYHASSGHRQDHHGR